MARQVSMRKKKVAKDVAHARLYIQSTFNNTIVTATDATGGTLTWATSGSMGFKGAKKSTPYAAQIATREVLERLKPFNVKSVEIFISGVGTGREQAVRALSGSGLDVTGIKDVTPIPHNGVRPKRPRKV